MKKKLKLYCSYGDKPAYDEHKNSKDFLIHSAIINIQPSTEAAICSVQFMLLFLNLNTPLF